MMNEKKTRKYKCYICGGIFEHWKYRYDSSPRGDDETICPLCGAVEEGEEVIEEEENEHI